MCTCNCVIGVVCPAHCRGDDCRNGMHTDLCVGPDRIPLLSNDPTKIPDLMQALKNSLAANGARSLGHPEVLLVCHNHPGVAAVDCLDCVPDETLRDP